MGDPTPGDLGLSAEDMKIPAGDPKKPAYEVGDKWASEERIQAYREEIQTDIDQVADPAEREALQNYVDASFSHLIANVNKSPDSDGLDNQKTVAFAEFMRISGENFRRTKVQDEHSINVARTLTTLSDTVGEELALTEAKRKMEQGE